MFGIRPVAATAAYTAVLVAIAVTLWALGPHAHDAAVSQMSTNLHNLARGQLGTLVGSAFVTDGGGICVWLPGLVCLLALGELMWRSARLVLVFALGHVGATLMVAVGLAVAIEVGWLPNSLSRATDVGISYGAAAVLGALTASLPQCVRLAWVGWWLGIAVLAASGLDFAAVGHTLALMLGIGLSMRWRWAPRWTLPRVVLLAAAVGFGYLLLSAASVMPAAGGLAGVLIALIGARAARREWGGNRRGRLARRERARPQSPGEANH